MLEQMENEDAYFHFFHELLTFEQLLKEKQLDEINNFDLRPFENVKERQCGEVKASSTRSRHYEKIKSGKHSHKKIDKDNTNETSTPSAKMEGNRSQTFSMKVQLRRAEIKHLLQLGIYWDEEDMYDGSLRGLIDLEESIAEGLFDMR